jgi:hypothetical protein
MPHVTPDAIHSSSYSVGNPWVKLPVPRGIALCAAAHWKSVMVTWEPQRSLQAPIGSVSSYHMLMFCRRRVGATVRCQKKRRADRAQFVYEDNITHPPLPTKSTSRSHRALALLPLLLVVAMACAMGGTGTVTVSSTSGQSGNATSSVPTAGSGSEGPAPTQQSGTPTASSGFTPVPMPWRGATAG